MANTVKRKQSKRQRFLEQLQLGWSISRAAKISGVSRAQLYRWRNADPKFADAWREAEDIGVDFLEDTAYARAVQGVETVTYNKAGKEVGRKIIFSDKLLILLLRRRRPRVYAKPETQIKETVQFKVPQTVEELRKRYQELALPMPLIEGDYEDVPEIEPGPPSTTGARPPLQTKS